MTAPPLPSPVRLVLRGLVLIGVFVLVGLVLRAMEDGTFLNAGWIDTEVRSRGLSGYLLFVGAGALFTAAGLPRQIVCFLGGYAYGFLVGMLVALAATVLGCAIAFLFARLMGRDLIAPRLPRRLRRADSFIADHPFSLTLLIRLLPVGSNLATNLVAGLSSAALVPFLAASAFGHLPQTLVFSLIGSGINVDPEARISLGIVLFAVSIAIGAYLYNRFRRNGAFGAAIDALVGNGKDRDDNGVPASGDPEAAVDRRPD